MIKLDLVVAWLKMNRGRVQNLWLWSPANLSTDESGDPHETNLKGERSGERSGEMGWSIVSKSEAWLGVGAVRIYIECIIGSWEAIAWGDQVWSFLLNFSYYHKSIQFYCCSPHLSVYRYSKTGLNK